MRSRALFASFGLLTLSLPCVSATEVVVDCGKTYQTIDGFGTCIVGWIPKISDFYRSPKFLEIYSDQMNFSMMRIPLWGPVLKEKVEDPARITYRDFDNTVNSGRPRIYLDVAKAIKKKAPETKLIATVWSPAGWMKENGNLVDLKSGGITATDYKGFNNKVKREYYPHYVKWIVEMAKEYAKEGAPFYAISPANEPQFTQTFESCVWNGEDLATITWMLGDALKKEGLGDIKIFGPETMTSHFYKGGTLDYIAAMMKDPRAAEYLYALATHGYEDGVKGEMEANSSAILYEAIKKYNKPFWVTEGGTGEHAWPSPIKKGIGTAIHNSLVAGHATAFVPWQITGEKATEHNIMVMDTFTPKSYTAMHYSRYIRPGMVRVDASPAFGDVLASAYLDKSRENVTTVLINPTNSEQTIDLEYRNTKDQNFKVWRTSANEQLKQEAPLGLKAGKGRIVLPPESIVTLASAGESLK